MAELRRSLTLFDMTMIAIGGTIGSGIFLTPSLIAGALPSPSLIIGAWLVGGLMALAGALTFSELAALMPRAGGEYVYLTEAYGGLVGFLFGWAYFLVCNAGGLGALSVAFATYAGLLRPARPGWHEGGGHRRPAAAHDGQRPRREGRRDLLRRLHRAEAGRHRRADRRGLPLRVQQHDHVLARARRRARADWRAASRPRWSASSGPPGAGSTPPTRRPRSRTRGARSRSR